jgi:hypothetical protein
MKTIYEKIRGVHNASGASFGVKRSINDEVTRCEAIIINKTYNEKFKYEQMAMGILFCFGFESKLSKKFCLVIISYNSICCLLLFDMYVDCDIPMILNHVISKTFIS